MMTKIYPDAGEQLIRSAIAYGDSDNGHLFYEEEHTNQIPEAEITNLVMKNLLLIHYNDAYYRPVKYSVSGAVGTAVVVEGETSTATFTSFKTKEA